MTIELNGAPARAEDLHWLVQTNYGHFSAMQVHEGCVRGLDLHLQRLVRSTQALFDTDLDVAFVRECMRHAVGTDSRPLSLRVNIFSRQLQRAHMTVPAAPDILIMTGPPASPAPKPLRLKSLRYERDLPQIKHVGTFALFQQRRLAQQAGFDDALFVDSNDCISEGSIWNIGFHDGGGIIWPNAAKLEGVSMQLLDAGLLKADMPSQTRSIPLRSIANFRTVFFTNASHAVVPIASIDDTKFAVDETLLETLVRCHEMNPWQRI